MTTVTDNNIFSPLQGGYSSQAAAASGQTDLDGLKDTIDQITNAMSSGNTEEAVPSMIDLLVRLKTQVASLMLESKELRSILVEAKADLAIEKGIEELKKIDTSKRSGIIGKIQSIVQPMLLAISCAAVLVVPTPVTVGLLLFSVGMYIDEEIASATGNDSLMSTMASKMEAGLRAILPPDVAEILAPLIVMVAMVVISVVATKGGMAMAGKANFPGAKQFQSFVAGKMEALAKDPVRAQQLAQQLTDRAILVGAVADQGLTVANSTFRYQTAQMQHTIEMLDADLTEMEGLSSMLDKLLNEFMGDYQKSKSWSVA